MLLTYAGEYATIKQINDAGGKVKKGEHSQTVFFAKYLDKKDEETGEVVDTHYFLKAYNVFRVGTQTEGIEPRYKHLWEGGGLPKDDAEVMDVITKYCTEYGIRLIAGGSEAFYVKRDDAIQVPGVDTFNNRSQFWHTVFHELIHSTGHPDRLKRIKHDHWGDSLYATEELVADIGACLCLGKLNLDTTECIANTASYIDGWKTRISNFKPSDFGECVRQAELACNMIFKTYNIKE
jgi:antirestriction protein ArdC